MHGIVFSSGRAQKKLNDVLRCAEREIQSHQLRLLGRLYTDQAYIYMLLYLFLTCAHKNRLFNIIITV